MAITGIDTIDGKQIIAAGAQSAVKAAQDSNGNNIASTYQSTAGMSNYATTADVTGKQDTLTFGYTNDQISQINGSAIYSQGGGAGVVTSTAGDGTYVTAINETPLSGAGGTQLVTSIHTAEYGVMAGTSATAVDRINGLGLFAQSGWSAVNAGWAKSAVSAYKDGNGRVITNTYQTTDGMTAYANSADVTGTAQYSLTTGGWTEITGGGSLPASADEACQVVTANSADWNEVSAKTDMNTVFGNCIRYSDKPESGAIEASQNNLVNVGQIVGSSNSNFYIVPSGVLQVPYIITAYDNGITANGITANTNSSFGGFTANGITANANSSGFSANGLSAGKSGPLWIQGETEIMSAYGGAGFTFSSQNTAFGTAKLTTANGNLIVQAFSPKFEARTTAGAGFSIEASGAKGYDHAGNVVWDTSVIPPANNLVGYVDTKASTGGLNGNIILTVANKTSTYPLSSAPYTILDAYGLSAAYGPSANVPSIQIKPDNIIIQTVTGNSARAQFGLQALGVNWETSAGFWSLTGSVQKRELEGDSAVSSISAIAGSALTCELPADLVYTATLSATSALLNDDIQTVSAAIPVLSSLNTEGITDIQLVNELPVDPVSTVLYLIPEA